jgi:hypothetical protein
MRLLPVRTANACALCCLTVAIIGNAALAQTTGTVNSSTPVENSPNEGPPPGGCMPIGLTASGEIVFPFQCKDFTERHKTAKPKPTALDDEKPNAAKEKNLPLKQRRFLKQCQPSNKSRSLKQNLPLKQILPSRKKGYPLRKRRLQRSNQRAWRQK